MDSKKAAWNSRQNELREILLKPDRHAEAIRLCLDQHAMVHSSEMAGSNALTFEDEVWDGLSDSAFRTMPTAKDETIAWNLWHITRIEDITMNILVAGATQVINAEPWLKRMNVTACDTGNAMTDEEIVAFSRAIDRQALRDYRIAVGRKTRAIIEGLAVPDLKRKMEPARLQRILDEGAVLNGDGARWLIDFWGRKNVAGLLLMPATRHQLVHLNESSRLKKVLSEKR
jgi:hypothetical protein